MTAVLETVCSVLVAMFVCSWLGHDWQLRAPHYMAYGGERACRRCHLVGRG